MNRPSPVPMTEAMALEWRAFMTGDLFVPEQFAPTLHQAWKCWYCRSICPVSATSCFNCGGPRR